MLAENPPLIISGMHFFWGKFVYFNVFRFPKNSIKPPAPQCGLKLVFLLGFMSSEVVVFDFMVGEVVLRTRPRIWYEAVSRLVAMVLVVTGSGRPSPLVFLTIFSKRSALFVMILLNYNRVVSEANTITISQFNVFTFPVFWPCKDFKETTTLKFLSLRVPRLKNV